MACILLIYMLSNNVLGQKKTYVANDGTNVDVEVINTNPADCKKACIYIGKFGLETNNLIGASYYSPDKYFINGLFGLYGGNIDISNLFINLDRKINIKQTVKSKWAGYHSRTNYKVKIPTNTRLSIGTHLGLCYINYSRSESREVFNIYSYNPYSAMGVFGGITFLSAKYVNWRIEDKYNLEGTSIDRINIDAIYYFNRKLLKNYDGNETIDDYTRSVGYRIYYEGKATFWGFRGGIGLNYMLGYGLNSSLQDLEFFFGLGVGYNFM